MATQYEIRKRRRPMAEINVVPYIDVMLVLLIIFMATAPLLNLGVQVDLPSADAEALQIDEDNIPIIITVMQTGDLYLNAAGDDAGLVTAEELIKQVSVFVRRNPKIEVLVAGDENTGYGKIYETMVLLQQAGVSKVGLMGDPVDKS
ncbi:MAG: protein TolR [Xanthomonadales bacterium]|nr:protein TolR [Xanthomonadales bacterium]